jgi:hypothetical protein
MASNRGRYAHGHDKDERFIRAYDRGWQVWWFLLALILVALIAASLGGIGVAVWTHHTNYDDVHRAYDQGFRDGTFGRDADQRARDATTTTTSTVPEPVPVRPGSGAPAADTPTSVVPSAAPAPPAPVPFVQHTG